MYLLIVIALLSAVEADQQFTCEPHPGCHFAKCARCSPLWSVTVTALRERNEFSIDCVKNGTDPKDEDQDKVLKSYKQKISELAGELTEAKKIVKKLEKNSDKTSKVIEDQTKTISKLTDDVVKANDKIKELEKNTGYCPLRYNGMCFWAEIRHDKVNLEQASQICASQGGRLANIYSKDHYYMMTGYMRMFTGNSNAYFHTWIGMTYNRWRNAMLLSDGSTAPFQKWRPGQPALHNCCNMYLFVRADANSREQHMSTAAPSFRLEGVFCQK